MGALGGVVFLCIDSNCPVGMGSHREGLRETTSQASTRSPPTITYAIRASTAVVAAAKDGSSGGEMKWSRARGICGPPQLLPSLRCIPSSCE